MKYLTLPLLILILLSSCEFLGSSNADNSSVDIDPYIAENYARDAKLLYMHEIYNDSTHPNYHNPEFDTTEVTEILEIFQHVYNLNIPERETVFNHYNIHARYCYSLNSISLKVDTTASEIKNMVNQDLPTGNDALDEILVSFQFDSVDTSYGYGRISDWLTVYSSKEFNMIPFKTRFESVSSILLAEIYPFCIGDGNSISLDRQPTGKSIITFSIGAGDCPSGCIYHRYWEFEVENGQAEFVRSYE